MAITPDERLTIAPIVGPDDPRRFTDSGIEIEELYDERDLARGPRGALGEPGDFPFTRGIHHEMYRDRLWTMRQYAGFASAEETNERYRYLLEHGSTGLSMAFDLPTQLGRDSDDPRCLTARSGAPASRSTRSTTCGSAFDEIPLDQVSTSMTINAPAAVLLLLYELVGEEQGVPSAEAARHVQNDVLKEYIARGNYIYPPEPTMRLTTDIFEYCHENVPKWNTISISGYHIREKGCSAVQEVAFTLSNAIAYVQAARRRAASTIDEFAPRLAFFFNGHNNVFQEVAKFRAARRMWATIMRERFGATNPKRADAPLPHADRRRDAARPSSRRTTSSASRCRASPRSAAAPSRCTPTASTRRWRCRPSAPRGSRCAPSRSSPTSRARPTRSTRSPAPTSSSR